MIFFVKLNKNLQILKIKENVNKKLKLKLKSLNKKLIKTQIKVK